MWAVYYSSLLFCRISPIIYINSLRNTFLYDDLTFNGPVYVLTSANSFRSAILFAQYIKDNLMGTLIGEEPGNAKWIR